MATSQVKVIDPEIASIQSYYQESFDFTYNRKQRQVNQLQLLNNLQRGDQNISSSMIITLHNRIVSNLYDDKMQVKFVPGEEIDQKKVSSLNLLAQNDYREMGKAQLDYDWIWDTASFGDGWCETLHFDKKRKILKPQIINPLVFGYDPFFPDIKDWRYYWKWIGKNKWEIEKMIRDGVIDGITSSKDIPSGMDPYLWNFKTLRDNAKAANTVSTDSINNDVYQILEMYKYDNNGDKRVYWIDSGFSKCLMTEKLDLRDNEDKSSKWPIVRKQMFREPHSSISTSVLDLLDDKHRAKSVLLNLAYIAAKDKANPLYVYNPDKVNDVSALFNRSISQHISVSDMQAIEPLNTANPMDSGLAQFIGLLTQEANDPIGTGMALQSPKKGKQSATETAIQQQLNDLAQSLQSKILQQGECDFWSHWYQRYKRYSKAGDEKIATILGVKGMTFEKIDLSDLYTKYPPGIMVFSAKEAEYKELVLRRDLQQMYPQFKETFSEDGMRNFNKYVFLPKFLSDPTIIDVLIPKTPDEIKAEEENDMMQANPNKLPQVAQTDNHEQHIMIHYMAKNSWAKWIHIQWHEESLGQQKQQQKQQQQQGQDMGDGAPSNDKGKGGNGADVKKPKVTEKQKNPMNAAVPLQGAAQPKTNNLAK